ncbi:MAG TPA: hypothetical protein VFX59_22160, partial [Polyangiales bacterium]|nr:hypothetical protein [Polyangiales bacterium]
MADVYEEALDDAADFGERMEDALEDAEHTLASLADGPEHTFVGALEVLEVDAGDRAVLRAVLDAPASPHHYQAALVATLRLGDVDSALAAMQHEDASLQAAAIRGCAWVRE